MVAKRNLAIPVQPLIIRSPDFHLCFKVFDCCLTLPCPVLQVKKDNAENIPITYYSSQQLFVLRIYGGTCRHTYLDQESSKDFSSFQISHILSLRQIFTENQICSNIFLMNDFCSIDVLICAKWWPALSAVTHMTKLAYHSWYWETAWQLFSC